MKTSKWKIWGVIVVLIVAMFPPMEEAMAEGNVIDIYKAEDLNNIRNDLSLDYRLMNNIDLSAYENWQPIGDSDDPFTGTLDGNGYTISNLTINRPNADGIGLFGYINGATLKNIELNSVDIKGHNHVGSLVGGARNASLIERSYATGSVDGNASVGGLVGDAGSSSSIEYSYATGTVDGNLRVGGLVGYAQSSTTIKQSYATGSVKGNHYVGGLVGYANYSSINQSYATGSVDGNVYVGGLVGVAENSATIEHSYAVGNVKGDTDTDVGGLVGLNFSSTVVFSYWDTETTGQKDSAGGEGKTTSELQQQSTYTNWDFDDTWMITEGVTYPIHQWEDGTDDNSNIIMTPQQLDDIRNRLDGDFQLGANIDLSEYDNWEPIGDDGNPFTGTLNGNGYTISNLTINRQNSDGIGLFGYIYEATLKNIQLNSVDIKGLNHVGGLAGSTVGSSIEQSYVAGDVEGIDIAGGLAGSAVGSSIEQSYTAGFVGGNDYVGGLAGVVENSSIKQSYATGSVGGNDYVGGLVGFANYSPSIEHSYATGTVEGDQAVGGLVGSAEHSSIAHSYATGTVEGEQVVGGLVGAIEEQSSIAQSYATGAASGDSQIGGLAGTAVHSSIEQSYATGSVEGYQSVGGLVGSVWSTSVTDSFYDRETTGQLDSAGGGEGKTTSELQQQSTYTNWDFDDTWRITEGVTYPVHQWDDGTDDNPNIIMTPQQLDDIRNRLDGDFQLGANIDLSEYDNWEPIGDDGTPFTGTLDGNGYTISNLTIDRPDEEYIGLFGYLNQATIKDMRLNNVDIKGDYYVGGLVGRASSSSIEQSYATGAVGGNSYVGGLVGYQWYSSIKQSYVTGVMDGDDNVGGLAGYATRSSIIQSYTTVAMDGDSYVGGLVGQAAPLSIEQSYATGDVVGDHHIGGLAGSASSASSIEQSYSTGSVEGNGNIGGLVGYLGTASSIEQSYATGFVDGNEDVGGLVGSVWSASVTDSFYDTETTSQSDSAGGGTGLETAEMQKRVTFEPEWDFAETWFMVNDKIYPVFISDNKQDPVLSLDSTETVKVTHGNDEEVDIQGTISDVKVGDTVYVKYTVRDEDGDLLPDYHRQHLVQLSDIDGTELDFSEILSININEEDFDLGAYTVDVYVKTLQATGESKIVSIPLEVYVKPDISIELHTANADGEDIAYTPGTWTGQDVDINANFQNDDPDKRQYALIEEGQTPQDDDWQAYTGDIMVSDTGQYTLYVRTENEAGYKQTERIEQIWIDADEPAAPEISLSEAGWTNAEQVQVTITPNADHDNGISKTEYRIGKGGIWLTYTTPFEVNVEGETTIYARSVDGVSNVSDPVEAITKIDRESPVMELNGETTVVMETGTTYADPGANAKHNRFGNLDDYIQTSGTIDTNQAGGYTLTYTVTDPAGNTSQIERTVHVVDITSLDITDYPAEVDPGQAYTIQVTTDYDGDNVPTITHNLHFASSDERVATVDTNGKVTFDQRGDVTITVTYGDQEATLVFIVEDYLLEISKEREVRPDAVYTVKGTPVKIKMPDDLPIGTKVKVDEYSVEEDEVQGLTPAGDIYTFTFDFPDGERHEGEYILTLSYNEDVNPEKIGIYYLNEETHQWEYRGGKVDEAQHLITLAVPYFSTYGVFAYEAHETPDDPKDERTSGIRPPEAKQDNDKEHKVASKLSDTATNHYNWIIVGILILITGGILMVYPKQRKEKSNQS